MVSELPFSVSPFALPAIRCVEITAGMTLKPQGRNPCRAEAQTTDLGTWAPETDLRNRLTWEAEVEEDRAPASWLKPSSTQETAVTPINMK